MQHFQKYYGEANQRFREGKATNDACILLKWFQPGEAITPDIEGTISAPICMFDNLYDMQTKVWCDQIAYYNRRGEVIALTSDDDFTTFRWYCRKYGDILVVLQDPYEIESEVYTEWNEEEKNTSGEEGTKQEHPEGDEIRLSDEVKTMLEKEEGTMFSIEEIKQIKRRAMAAVRKHFPCESARARSIAGLMDSRKFLNNARSSENEPSEYDPTENEASEYKPAEDRPPQWFFNHMEKMQKEMTETITRELEAIVFHRITALVEHILFRGQGRPGDRENYYQRDYEAAGPSKNSIVDDVEQVVDHIKTSSFSCGDDGLYVCAVCDYNYTKLRTTCPHKEEMIGRMYIEKTASNSENEKKTERNEHGIGGNRGMYNRAGEEEHLIRYQEIRSSGVRRSTSAPINVADVEPVLILPGEDPYNVNSTPNDAGRNVPTDYWNIQHQRNNQPYDRVSKNFALSGADNVSNDSNNVHSPNGFEVVNHDDSNDDDTMLSLENADFVVITPPRSETPLAPSLSTQINHGNVVDAINEAMDDDMGDYNENPFSDNETQVEIVNSLYENDDDSQSSEDEIANGAEEFPDNVLTERNGQQDSGSAISEIDGSEKSYDMACSVSTDDMPDLEDSRSNQPSPLYYRYPRKDTVSPDTGNSGKYDYITALGSHHFLPYISHPQVSAYRENVYEAEEVISDTEEPVAPKVPVRRTVTEVGADYKLEETTDSHVLVERNISNEAAYRSEPEKPIFSPVAPYSYREFVHRDVSTGLGRTGKSSPRDVTSGDGPSYENEWTRDDLRRHSRYDDTRYGEPSPWRGARRFRRSVPHGSARFSDPDIRLLHGLQRPETSRWSQGQSCRRSASRAQELSGFKHSWQNHHYQLGEPGWNPFADTRISSGYEPQSDESFEVDEAQATNKSPHRLPVFDDIRISVRFAPQSDESSVVDQAQANSISPQRSAVFSDTRISSRYEPQSDESFVVDQAQASSISPQRSSVFADTRISSRYEPQSDESFVVDQAQASSISPQRSTVFADTRISSRYEPQSDESFEVDEAQATNKSPQRLPVFDDIRISVRYAPQSDESCVVDQAQASSISPQLSAVFADTKISLRHEPQSDETFGVDQAQASSKSPQRSAVFADTRISSRYEPQSHESFVVDQAQASSKSPQRSTVFADTRISSGDEPQFDESSVVDQAQASSISPQLSAVFADTKNSSGAEPQFDESFVVDQAQASSNSSQRLSVFSETKISSEDEPQSDESFVVDRAQASRTSSPQRASGFADTSRSSRHEPQSDETFGVDQAQASSKSPQLSAVFTDTKISSGDEPQFDESFVMDQAQASSISPSFSAVFADTKISSGDEPQFDESFVVDQAQASSNSSQRLSVFSETKISSEDEPQSDESFVVDRAQASRTSSPQRASGFADTSRSSRHEPQSDETFGVDQAQASSKSPQLSAVFTDTKISSGDEPQFDESFVMDQAQASSISPSFSAVFADTKISSGDEPQFDESFVVDQAQASSNSSQRLSVFSETKISSEDEPQSDESFVVDRAQASRTSSPQRASGFADTSRSSRHEPQSDETFGVDQAQASSNSSQCSTVFADTRISSGDEPQFDESFVIDQAQASSISPSFSAVFSDTKISSGDEPQFDESFVVDQAQASSNSSQRLSVFSETKISSEDEPQSDESFVVDRAQASRTSSPQRASGFPDTSRSSRHEPQSDETFGVDQVQASRTSSPERATGFANTSVDSLREPQSDESYVVDQSEWSEKSSSELSQMFVSASCSSQDEPRNDRWCSAIDDGTDSDDSESDGSRSENMQILPDNIFASASDLASIAVIGATDFCMQMLAPLLRRNPE